MKTVTQNLLIRMVLFLFWYVSIMLMFMACSPYPPGPDSPNFDNHISNGGGTSYREFAVADIPSDKLPYILADTITPPSNPMAPDDLSQYPTFVGTLQMFQISGIENLKGQYFCGIRLHTPIMIDGYEYSIMYLLNYSSEVLTRFNHPMLESCVVGDTIYVTGEPKAISGGLALGLTMRYVQPK